MRMAVKKVVRVVRIFSNQELIDITNEKRQRIQYLILKRVFEPYHPGSGVGTNRTYSFKNLLEVMIAKEISTIYMNVDHLKLALDFVRDEAPNIFDKNVKVDLVLTIYADSQGAIGYWLKSTEQTLKEAKKWLPKGKKLLLIDLNAVKTYLERRIIEVKSG